MRRASGVPAGTQHGGGFRCAHRWFPLAKPRFTTGYRPGCLRHPSTFMKCTTSLQQGCSEPLSSPQHTMRHQDLRKHRHAWQHSLGVVRQPGGLAACSRWSREAWRPIPPDHEVPRPHAPASRRGCQPAASSHFGVHRLETRLCCHPSGMEPGGCGQNHRGSGGVALRAQPPATGGEPSGFKIDQTS